VTAFWLVKNMYVKQIKQYECKTSQTMYAKQKMYAKQIKMYAEQTKISLQK